MLRRLCSIQFILLFCMLSGSIAVSAQNVPDKTISISIQQSKLGNVLKAIQEKASVQIVFSTQLVEPYSVQSLVVRDESLSATLRQALKGTNLTFALQNGVIIIQRRQAKGNRHFRALPGVVQTEDKKPLSFVTIANITMGGQTLSNLEGKFNIQANIGDTLVLTYVGFEPYRITVESYEKLHITLKKANASIDEVVLTGYQSIKKRYNTSSIYTLKGEDIAEANVSNIASMLQGKVPGLSIETLSGSPNSIPRMRMRGTSTLIGNGNPIWVVDGVVQENPVDINPDNVMGLNPSWLDEFVRGDVMHASADLMGNSIAGVNINDVESISFLKDASATALYGTRAANGVIVITTKKGKQGPPVLTYSTNLGFVQRPSYNQMELMNSKERIQLSREFLEAGMLYKRLPLGYSYEGAYWDFIKGDMNQAEFDRVTREYEMQNTDWFDILFRNSFNQTHSISLSGGSQKARYISSLSYNNNRGAAKQDNLNLLRGRVGIHGDLSEKLTLDFNINGSHRSSNGFFPGVNPLSYAIRTSRTIAPDLFYPTLLASYGPAITAEPFLYNFLNELEQTGNETKNSQLNSNFSIRYQLLPSLKFTSLLAGSISIQNSDQYATERSYSVASQRGYDYGSVVPGGPEEAVSALPYGGTLNNSVTNKYAYSWRNMLEYSTPLFGQKHQLKVILGQELSSLQYKGYSQYQYGYLKDRGESFAVMPNYYGYFIPKKENKIVNSISGFSTVSYRIRNKYIIDGSVRMDASNRFGQFSNSRFLPVWSVSGRWNVSDEPWFENSVVNRLNLRASYGWQGNAVTAVGPDLITRIPAYSAVHPLAKEYIMELQSLAYPDLRWEKTKSYNAELHMGLFNSFVELGVAVYKKETNDAITTLNLPEEYGFKTSSMYINGGTITNKGIEATVNFNIIQNKNWTWSLGGNTYKNFNNLRKGPDDLNYSLYDYISGDAQTPDQPIGTYYVFRFKGLSPEHGLPLFKEIDEVEDPTLLRYMDYLMPVKPRDSELKGGLSTNLRYKNWSLNAHFSFAVGAIAPLNPYYSGENAQLQPFADQNLGRDLNRRWKKPGDEAFTNIPAFVGPFVGQMVQYGGNNKGGSEIDTRYWLYEHSDIMLAPADYLKLRTLSLGYRIPEAWLKSMHLSSASVSMSATNVLRLANKRWKGQDPEIPGVGSSALPQVPAYNLGLNVSF